MKKEIAYPILALAEVADEIRHVLAHGLRDSDTVAVEPFSTHVAAHPKL